MKRIMIASFAALSAFTMQVFPASRHAASTSVAPATSRVDPAKEAEHTNEDVRRHRQIAAAHEAAAKCQESGKDESYCNAELAKTCKGIAYGKYCGMKHPD